MQEEILHSSIPTYKMVYEPEYENDIQLIEGVTIRINSGWVILDKDSLATSMLITVLPYIGKSFTEMKRNIKNGIDRILFDAVACGLIHKK